MTVEHDSELSRLNEKIEKLEAQISSSQKIEEVKKSDLDESRRLKEDIEKQQKLQDLEVNKLKDEIKVSSL